MSDTSRSREAASEKRRTQARERQRKRGDLNRHYLEEEALRALDAGVLKRQEVELSARAQRDLRFIADRLSSDAELVINLAIGFADSLVQEGRTSVEKLSEGIGNQSVFISFPFTPTPKSIQAILRAGHRDARSIYAESGLRLLTTGLVHSSSNIRDIIPAKRNQAR